MPAAVPLEPSLSVLAWVQEEMRPSSQQEHSLPLPAEPEIPPLSQAVPVGMLVAARQAVQLRQVSLMVVCQADRVRQAPARSRSSRRSIRLICRP